MEDAATAEISRSQLWQWVHNQAQTAEGVTVSADLVRRIADEEMETIRTLVGDEAFASGRFEQARRVFEKVALAPEFVEFLTLAAYDEIN